MLTYLAAPYGHPDPKVVAHRMEVFNKIDGQLLRAGKFTVSPLSKVAGLSVTELPSDWEYWQHYSRELLAKCDEMIVILLDGWVESAGVQGEVEFATTHNIPIAFITTAGEIIRKSA